jgi:hypothetical protein
MGGATVEVLNAKLTLGAAVLGIRAMMTMAWGKLILQAGDEKFLREIHLLEILLHMYFFGDHV